MKVLYNQSSIIKRISIVSPVIVWEPKFKHIDLVWDWYESANKSVGESLLDHNRIAILSWEADSVSQKV